MQKPWNVMTKWTYTLHLQQKHTTWLYNLISVKTRKVWIWLKILQMDFEILLKMINIPYYHSQDESALLYNTYPPLSLTGWLLPWNWLICSNIHLIISGCVKFATKLYKYCNTPKSQNLDKKWLEKLLYILFVSIKNENTSLFDNFISMSCECGL